MDDRQKSKQLMDEWQKSHNAKIDKSIKEGTINEGQSSKELYDLKAKLQDKDWMKTIEAGIAALKGREEVAFSKKIEALNKAIWKMEKKTKLK